MSQPMLCAYCGEEYVWPEDFPNTGYAKCARCCAKDGIARSRPDWPGVFVAMAVALVVLAACYKCTDPGCTNVPPVDPGPPPEVIDVRPLDAGGW